MNKNIGAYTATGPLYPEFISVNMKVNDPNKFVTTTVRGPEKVGSSGRIEPGEVVEIVMTKEQFENLLDEIIATLDHEPVDPNQHKLPHIL